MAVKKLRECEHRSQKPQAHKTQHAISISAVLEVQDSLALAKLLEETRWPLGVLGSLIEVDADTLSEGWLVVGSTAHAAHRRLLEREDGANSGAASEASQGRHSLITPTNKRKEQAGMRQGTKTGLMMNRRMEGWDGDGLAKSACLASRARNTLQKPRENLNFSSQRRTDRVDVVPISQHSHRLDGTACKAMLRMATRHWSSRDKGVLEKENFGHSCTLSTEQTKSGWKKRARPLLVTNFIPLFVFEDQSDLGCIKKSFA
jgi:hypothetical protein